MDQKDIYRQFIDWLNQTWWGLPPADELLPLIQTCYTPEEAELLTGMPFSGGSLEELAAAKGMEPSLEAKNRTGKVAVLDPEKCIGCGVCTFQCPTNSLILQRREKTQHPPVDPRDYMQRFFAERKSKRSVSWLVP